MAKSGVTHDVVIKYGDDERGIMLASDRGKRLWNAGPAPLLPARFATVEAQYVNFPPDVDLPWSQDNWREGMGHKDLQSLDSFHISKGLYSRTNGKLHLGPKVFTTGLAGGAPVGTGTRFGEKFGDAFYITVGNSLYKWSVADQTWALMRTFALTITHLKAYKTWLLVAQGPTAKFWYSTNGSSWTQSALTGAEAVLFHEGPGGAQVVGSLWLANGNELRSTQDPTVSLSGITEVGTEAADIIGMYTQAGSFIIQKEDGLYSMDETGAIVELKRYLPLTNAVQAGMVVDLDLFFPQGYQMLHRAASGAYAHVGVEARTAAFANQVWSMAFDGVFYYAAVEARDGTYYVLIGERLSSGEIVWDVLVDCATLPCKMVAVSDVDTPNLRLWFGLGNTVAYVILSRFQGDMLEDPNCRFTNYGVLYSSINDLGWAAGRKTFDRWSMTREQLAAGMSVTLSYSIDGGEWQTAGTQVGTTQGEFYLGRQETGTRIQYRLELRSDSDIATPVVRDLRLHARLRLEAVPMFQFTVRCADNVETLAGRPEAAGARLATFLRNLQSVVEPVYLWDRFGVGWRVNITDARDAELAHEPGHEPEMAVAVTAYAFDQHVPAYYYNKGHRYNTGVTYGRMN